MGQQKGFTLIELMTASLLAGMILVIALPFLILGQNTIGITGKAAEISVKGDAMFEYISDELKMADDIWLAYDGGEPPENGEWNVLYIGDSDFILDVQVLNPSGILLSVVFEENGQVLYEREEAIWTVRLATDSNVKRGRDKGVILWYRKRSDEHEYMTKEGIS